MLPLLRTQYIFPAIFLCKKKKNKLGKENFRNLNTLALVNFKNVIC